jgi:ABC-type sugar transport system ATPase subunit
MRLELAQLRRWLEATMSLVTDAPVEAMSLADGRLSVAG